MPLSARVRRSIAALCVALAGVAPGCVLWSNQSPALPGSGSDSVRGQPTANFTTEERRRIALVQPWVDSAAYQYEVEPNLINGVIWVESRFQPRAKSPAGARGLMQLMPATATSLARSMGKGRAASYDPEFNIAAGTLYVKKMMRRYKGDINLALAAYNAGPGNVDKWTRNGRTLPPNSQRYVELVMDAKHRFDDFAGASDAPAPQSSRNPSRKSDTLQRPRKAARPVTPATDFVPTPPVRYDLDRVESQYTPRLEREPALADTPPPTRRRRPSVSRPPRPRPVAKSTQEQGLPSVLD